MADKNWPMGQSETAELIRAKDWSKTSLGPISDWPASLKISIQLVLDSRFPMYIWWGPEYINIYNDAYIALAGKKNHPKHFGKPAQHMWPEIWPTLTDFLTEVKTKGTSILHEDLHLPLERMGSKPEDAYFSFSYGPARDENGEIQGIHCTCYETTSKIHAQRELIQSVKQTELAVKQLQSFFIQSPVPMAIMLNHDHRFTIVNPPYEKLINRKNIVGKTVLEVFDKEDVSDFHKLLDQVYESGKSHFGTETLLPLADENGILHDTWLDFGYHPYRDENGEIRGVLAIVTDVTSQVLSKKVLEKAGEEFKLIANSMPQHVWNANADGELDYFNDVWFDYSGTTFEDNVGNGWIKYVHHEDVPRTIETWMMALNSGVTYTHEFRLRRHDGSYRWHMTRSYPIKDSQGHITRWIGTNTDVHESKTLTSTLESEKIKFETLFADASTSMALLRGKDLIFEQSNPSYHALFDNRVKIGVPILEIMPELIGQPFAKLLQDVYRTGVDYREAEAKAYLRRTHDGPLEERYFRQSYTQVKNADGSPYGVFIHAIDITESVKIRKRVEVSEERMNLALDAAQMGTWSIDLKTMDVKTSETFMKIFDFGFVGGNIFEEISRLMHPDDVDEVNRIWQSSIAERIPYIHEYRIVTESGQIKWVHSRGRATYDTDGTPLVLAGILMDITDKKLADERLEKLALDLQIAVATRDEFLSIASHELKTPLTSMKLQTQSIQRSLSRGLSLPPEKITRLVDNTATQVGRLTRLVDDMLDIARIQSGKFTLHKEPMKLNDILSHIYSEFTEQFDHARCQTTLEMKSEARGEFDRFKLEQVITNLLSNAIRYGSGKPIEVKLDVVTGKAIITVTDHGIGIDPANFEKIFHRFERIIDAKGINGLGLGLYITKQIVLAHNGEIRIESELGKGASFIVELPL